MITQPTPPTPASSPGWLRKYGGLLVVLAAILFIAGVRIRLKDCPLERDEGEYAYAGQLMLQGIPPYQLAYNMKFPGTYAAYAVMMAVFGETPAGIHLGVLCLTTLTALMLYWLGRQMLDEVAGVVAATTAVFMSASPPMCGLAGHATHFAAFFTTAGACLLWKTLQSRRRFHALGAGVMFGLAVLMKQQAIFMLLWGWAALATYGWRQPEARGIKKLEIPMASVLGAALPFGLTCLLLWRAGVFGKFWFWTVDYARAYITDLPLHDVPAMFSLGISSATTRGGAFWLLAGLGLVLTWFDERLKPIRLWLGLFFVAAFLTTCPGFYFRFHYFLLMIPALALLAGCGLSTVWKKLHFKQGKGRPWLAVAYAGAFLFTGWENVDIWFKLTPAQVIHGVYRYEAFPEMQQLAEFIRTNSTPADRVAVLGSEPEVYFLSQRHSATGYLYVYPLFERNPYAARMQSEMIREVESANPKFIVFMRVNRSWGIHDESNLALFDWWYHSYQTNYAVVGMTEVDPPNSWRYFWGEEAARHAAGTQTTSALVYQRKDSL